MPPQGTTEGNGAHEVEESGKKIGRGVPAPAKGDGGSWSRLRLGLSERVMGLRNPIRELTEDMSPPNPEKRVISLAVGDPSSAGLAAAPENAAQLVSDVCTAASHNGYTNSCGSDECRKAIADATGARSSDDVFVCQGCSQGLMHSIAALAVPGANILMPRPGFPLYHVLAGYYGVEARFYNLRPDSDWQVDIEEMVAVADENTCAIVLCNPSNPCGAVYPREHLDEVVSAAARLRVPIIADEVYSGISWGEHPFVPLAEVATDPTRDAEKRVPVIEVGAVSKKFVVPGWRLGWIVLHDTNGIFESSGVRTALTKLQQITLSANSLVQAALPTLLHECPPAYHRDLNASLAAAARQCYDRCATVPGLDAVSLPQGAMYLMCRVDVSRFGDEIPDDRAFADLLVREESVKVLPGACFSLDGYIRIVFAATRVDLDEAWDRIEAFCKRHVKEA